MKKILYFFLAFSVCLAIADYFFDFSKVISTLRHEKLKEYLNAKDDVFEKNKNEKLNSIKKERDKYFKAEPPLVQSCFVDNPDAVLHYNPAEAIVSIGGGSLGKGEPVSLYVKLKSFKELYKYRSLSRSTSLSNRNIVNYKFKYSLGNGVVKGEFSGTREGNVITGELVEEYGSKTRKKIVKLSNEGCGAFSIGSKKENKEKEKVVNEIEERRRNCKLPLDNASILEKLNKKKYYVDCMGDGVECYEGISGYKIYMVNICTAHTYTPNLIFIKGDKLFSKEVGFGYMGPDRDWMTKKTWFCRPEIKDEKIKVCNSVCTLSNEELSCSEK